jgi:hypothetical protein
MTYRHAETRGREAIKLQHAGEHAKKCCAIRAQFLLRDPVVFVVDSLCVSASLRESIS